MLNKLCTWYFELNGKQEDLILKFQKACQLWKVWFNFLFSLFKMKLFIDLFIVKVSYWVTESLSLSISKFISDFLLTTQY